MGQLNRPSNILPRVKAYDSRSLNLMIASDKACSATNSENAVWGSNVVSNHLLFLWYFYGVLPMN